MATEHFSEYFTESTTEAALLEVEYTQFSVFEIYTSGKMPINLRILQLENT